MEYEPRNPKKYEKIRKKDEEKRDFPFPDPNEIDSGSFPTSFFEDGSEEQIILKAKGCIRGWKR